MNRLSHIAAPPAPKAEERFLLPVTRSELELFAAHAAALYAIELARATAPELLVLTSEGVEKYPEFMAALAGKSLSSQAARFLDGRTVGELHDLVNRFQRLKGEATV